MADHESIIHLSDYKKAPEGEPKCQPVYQKTVTISVTQDEVDGINALIHWLSGYTEGHGGGRIPGHFNLVMLYRSMRAAMKSDE